MLFNETFFGLLLHKQLKSKKAFQYPEERADFVVPEHFKHGYASRQGEQKQQNKQQQEPSTDASSTVTAAETPGQMGKKSEKMATLANQSNDDELQSIPTSMTEPHPYLVDWDGPEDTDNPQAWPSWKKVMFTSQLMLLTTSVYMGSSIVSPGIPLIAEQFNVGHVAATLALTLFVLGYAIGPMIGLCSASEIPQIGRCLPYVVTLFFFVILQIPTALVDNIAGLMILRFLAGLVGSPPLATGGASVGDVFPQEKAPLALAMCE